MSKTTPEKLEEPDNENSDNKELTPLEESHEAYIPEEVKPLLKALPKNEQAQFHALLALSIKRTWRGPLPPPDLLKDYNEAIPNGADRILIMTENQSKHRIATETMVISGELKQSGRGQNYAFLIAILVLIASFVLIYTGHDVAGSVLGGLDLVALTSVFILGKYAQHKDLNSKK